jgi:3-isopropylmalate/(R)-2-methylmalate dehydratase small subunit
MQPFTTHSGIVAALPQPNIDTDQIIPKQFLKRIERTGFGEFLFFDWRYQADGSPNPAFALNAPDAAGASILLAGPNFGCGSSREHAPWALGEYGFRAVISTSFADIFSSNCGQNGILAACVTAPVLQELFARAARPGPQRLTLDLERRTVADADGWSAPFTVGDYHRQMLLAGLDEIGKTLTQEPAIAAYEARLAAAGR